MFVQGQRLAMFLWQSSSKVVAMFLWQSSSKVVAMFLLLDAFWLERSEKLVRCLQIYKTTYGSKGESIHGEFVWGWYCVYWNLCVILSDLYTPRSWLVSLALYSYRIHRIYHQITLY